MGDPIKNWHAKVGAPILELPEVRAKRQLLRKQAHDVGRLISPAVVFRNAADGRALSNVPEAVISDNEAREINKVAQRTILAIVRYLSLLIITLSEAAHTAGTDFIPYMGRQFRILCGDNAILRRYKTWPPRS